MILNSIFSTKTRRSADPQPDLRFPAGEDGWPLRVVRHAQARRMSLQLVAREKAVRLTLPPRAPLKPALAWVETRRGWVEAQIARRAASPDSRICPGMDVPFRGEMVRLDWSAQYPRQPRLEDGVLRIGGPEAGLAARLIRWLRHEALILLESETRALAAHRGLAVTTVRVGDPARRWGSCSSTGAIRYSWRLILMPDGVRRMIVAHEVAHLVHMDHSPAFHRLAAELAGEDPKVANRWLRTHAARIHQFGAD